MALVPSNYKRNEIRRNILVGPAIRLAGSVGRAPSSRAGDLGSNPGPGESFLLLKL